VRERQGQCGIIYARLRKTCDWLASELQNAEIEAAAYHAGKDTQQRSRVSWAECPVGFQQGGV
jgi:superfamily II DNA helicase RecQ